MLDYVSWWKTIRLKTTEVEICYVAREHLSNQFL